MFISIIPTFTKLVVSAAIFSSILINKKICNDKLENTSDLLNIFFLSNKMIL